MGTYYIVANIDKKQQFCGLDFKQSCNKRGATFQGIVPQIIALLIEDNLEYTKKDFSLRGRWCGDRVVVLADSGDCYDNFYMLDRDYLSAKTKNDFEAFGDYVEEQYINIAPLITYWSQHSSDFPTLTIEPSLHPNVEKK